MIVKYPFFPLRGAREIFYQHSNSLKLCKKVLSQDINKLEGFFFFFVCVWFFSLKEHLYICNNSCEQCQFSTSTLYFNSFWTENALQARTTIRNAILLQIYEKLSSSESSVCKQHIVKTHMYENNLYIQTCICFFFFFFTEHCYRDLLTDEQTGLLISCSNGVHFQFKEHNTPNPNLWHVKAHLETPVAVNAWLSS